MDSNSLVGIQLINPSGFFILLMTFLLDLIVIIIITRLIYYRVKKNRNFLFTFTIFNIVIFLVCSLLNQLTLSIGFAFGIFAIFSILRYRTISIPIREMTYFFIAIAVGIINSLSSSHISVVELLFTNTAIVVVTYLLEKVWMGNEIMKYVTYEKIELIKPQNHEKLLSDLQERTGLDVHRFEIGRINYLRDTAEIRIFYRNNGNFHYVNESDNDDDDE